jgi:hypothetical protein
MPLWMWADIYTIRSSRPISREILCGICYPRKKKKMDPNELLSFWAEQRDPAWIAIFSRIGYIQQKNRDSLWVYYSKYTQNSGIPRELLSYWEGSVMLMCYFAVVNCLFWNGIWALGKQYVHCTRFKIHNFTPPLWRHRYHSELHRTSAGVKSMELWGRVNIFITYKLHKTIIIYT